MDYVANDVDAEMLVLLHTDDPSLVSPTYTSFQTFATVLIKVRISI